MFFKIDIGHNFLIIDNAFILLISISCDKIFLMVSRYLYLWPKPSLELAISGAFVFHKRILLISLLGRSCTSLAWSRDICSDRLCVCGSCGFLGRYAWRSFDSHHWLSAPEPELADVFTEVGEIIWLPPFVSRNLSWSLSKVKHKMAYLVLAHYICLFESRMGTNCWLKLTMFYEKQCLG